MIPYLLLILLLAVSGALAFAWHVLRLAQQEIDRLDDVVETQGLEMVRLRARDLEVKKHAETLLIHMAPLVEKTDWMTGRWHGKFNELVRLENQRNQAAEHIRKALFEMPGIRDFTKAHGRDLFKGATTQGLRSLIG